MDNRPFTRGANVDLTTFESSIVIRIFTLIQAATALTEALPRLHGNVDDMARHLGRFDNFFRMCTKLFEEVFYKFDLFRAFIDEVKTLRPTRIVQLSLMPILVNIHVVGSSIVGLIRFVNISIGIRLRIMLLYHTPRLIMNVFICLMIYITRIIGHLAASMI